MSGTLVQAGSRWRVGALWALKGVLAAVFLGAGGAKLVGVPMMVENFSIIGLGQWFRYLTGSLEVIGAIALLVPASAALGAALLAMVMVGATLTHLIVLPGPFLPAVVLFALCAVVVYAHRERIVSILRPAPARAGV